MNKEKMRKKLEKVILDYKYSDIEEIGDVEAHWISEAIKLFKKEIEQSHKELVKRLKSLKGARSNEDYTDGWNEAIDEAVIETESIIHSNNTSNE